MTQQTAKTASVFATLMGCPNVGKSSLLNLLVGGKIAIVSPKPQTTRNRITGVITKGPMQYVFLDTPGFHKAKNTLSAQMLTAISDTLSETELGLFLTDSAPGITAGEKKLLADCKQKGLTLLLVINKIDLLEDKTPLLEKINLFCQEAEFAGVVPISVTQKDGIDLLFQELDKFAQEGPHYFDPDTLTDQPEKKLLSELVREQLLLQLDQEIPHGTGVYIEQMEDMTDQAGVVVHGVIVCEKDSHKGIIIGKGGARLKQIGIKARHQMADLLGCPVHLKLFIKVKEDWRNKPQVIRQLGLDATQN